MRFNTAISSAGDGRVRYSRTRLRRRTNKRTWRRGAHMKYRATTTPSRMAADRPPRRQLRPILAAIGVMVVLATVLSAPGCGTSAAAGAPTSTVVTTAVTSPDAPSTTTGSADTIGSTTSSQTGDVASSPVEELYWGQTATVDNVSVSMSTLVIDPDLKSSRSGFVIVYASVVISNNGQQAITHSPEGFSLEASSSGSGPVTVNPPGGRLTDLGAGTLSPGQSATGIVRFNMKEGDTPLLVSLVVPWNRHIRINWR
jgi:hypothetical protein